MKKSHLIAICAVAIVACGISLAQPPKTSAPDFSGRIPATSIPGPNARQNTTWPSIGGGGVSPAALAELPKEEVKPEDMSIEQLIEAMEKTRAEIVEREKKNQAQLKVLQDKIAKVNGRMGAFTEYPQLDCKPEKGVLPPVERRPSAVGR